MSMSLLHVQVPAAFQYQCCKSLLGVHVLLHVHVYIASPCLYCMSMPMSMLHVQAHAALSKFSLRMPGVADSWILGFVICANDNLLMYLVCESITCFVSPLILRISGSRILEFCLYKTTNHIHTAFLLISLIRS